MAKCVQAKDAVENFGELLNYFNFIISQTKEDIEKPGLVEEYLALKVLIDDLEAFNEQIELLAKNFQIIELVTLKEEQFSSFPVRLENAKKMSTFSDETMMHKYRAVLPLIDSSPPPSMTSTFNKNLLLQIRFQLAYQRIKDSEKAFQ